MRCPKCGYNSFDHLDSCKKCGKDLIEYKQRYGIVSVLFPGQMKPTDLVNETQNETEIETEVSIAGAAVAAAAVTAAATTEAAVEAEVEAEVEVAEVEMTEAAKDASGDADDFGFDFMGDSEEEEDLSFDELFDDAPADEDVEETLPGPEQESAKTDEIEVSGDALETADDEGDFAFDLTGDDESDETDTAVTELEHDFGFDPAEDSDDTEEISAGPAEDLAEEDFSAPPEEEDEFSFETDEVEFDEEQDEDSVEGAEEDPKDPFDLPEPSLQQRAPEQAADHLAIGSKTEAADLEIFSEPAALSEVSQTVAESGPLRAAESAAVGIADELSSESLDVSATAAELTQQDPAKLPEDPTPGGEVQVALAGLTADEPGLEEPADGPGYGLIPATGSRIAAFCCDLLLLLVIDACFLVAAEAAMSTDNASLLPSLETLIDLSVPYFLVLFSLAFGYFTLFHFLAGQTPGKMLAGLRVETVAGEPLLFSHAFLRAVGGLLQLLPIGLGYLVILFNSERRGWNDQLAGTRLISLKGLPEEV